MNRAHPSGRTGAPPGAGVAARLFTRMQRVAALGVGVTALLLAAGCAHRATVASEPAVVTLQERQSDFLEALVAKDLDRAVAHFAEDAVVHIANMPPIEGRDAIRHLYGNVLRFLQSAEYVPERLRVSKGGDLAYGSGRVTTVFAGEQGVAEYPGKYLLVWQMRDGAWSVAAYAISNNRGN